MIENKDVCREAIKGKRIMGVDFGFKRVGLAVADELGITVTPKVTLDFENPNFWDKLLDFIKAERIKACVVGVPYRNDNEKTAVIEAIEIFCNKLKLLSKLDVFVHDESYTSIDAGKTMIEIGKKKKKRSEKGEKDKIAAAIILKDFINQYL